MTTSQQEHGPSRAGDGACPPDRPIRVLFVQDHLARLGEGSHGVTSYLATTLPAFPRAAVEARLCVPAGRRGLAVDLAVFDPPPVLLGRAKWDPRTFGDLLRVTREWRPDLLHVSAFKSMIIGRIVARIVGRPCVVHLHDANPLSPPIALAQRAVAGWTDGAVAVSASIAAFGRTAYSLGDLPIQVLHNGVPTDRFTADAAARRHSVREALGVPADTPLLGVVGRVVQGKGQDHLVEAMAAVLRAVPAAQALVVGDGPALAGLRRRAVELGVAHAVRFLGFRSDVPDLLCAIDVAVVPSLVAEGLGYTAIEACAAGLPVVAYASGGLPEAVADGESGLLVRPGDIAGLGEAIARLLGDAQLRARLAAGARQRAPLFSVESHVAALEALYRDVLRRRQPQPAEHPGMVPVGRPARSA